MDAERWWPPFVEIVTLGWVLLFVVDVALATTALAIAKARYVTVSGVRSLADLIVRDAAVAARPLDVPVRYLFDVRDGGPLHVRDDGGGGLAEAGAVQRREHGIHRPGGHRNGRQLPVPAAVGVRSLQSQPTTHPDSAACGERDRSAPGGVDGSRRPVS